MWSSTLTFEKTTGMGRPRSTSPTLVPQSRAEDSHWKAAFYLHEQIYFLPKDTDKNRTYILAPTPLSYHTSPQLSPNPAWNTRLCLFLWDFILKTPCHMQLILNKFLCSSLANLPFVWRLIYAPWNGYGQHIFSFALFSPHHWPIPSGVFIDINNGEERGLPS